MIPHRTPFFLPWLYPTLTWRMENKHELYLTFDDGPFAGPTDFVLNQLNTFSAKATFFCIGDNVRKHDQLFREIISEGHRVGNHTHNHVNGWKASAEEYKSNIEKCDHQLSTFLQGENRSKLFRPPYGRITRKQINALQSQYKIIMWDVLSRDYDKTLSPEKCLKNTVAATRPGSIVVFHDSLKAERNLKYALPRFLEHFKEKGFIFKTL